MESLFRAPLLQGKVADDAWRTRFAAQPTPVLITQGFIARHGDGGTAILGRGLHEYEVREIGREAERYGTFDKAPHFSARTMFDTP